MILNNLHIINGSESLKSKCIVINGNTISKISDNKERITTSSISFSEDVIAFPGLINSHDHLAVNTHPIHKHKIYKDYIEWANDNFEETIKEIELIPFELRYKWGILKNVLNGCTTVFQHDRYLKHYSSKVIDIETKTTTIHSLHYSNRWKTLVNFPNRQKKVIHLAEGTSSLAKKEPKELLKWCLFPKRIIAVHGIQLKVNEAKALGGLIWCPNSNLNLYDKTANIKKIKNTIPILFGTDSTISADWNLWNHLRQARNLQQLSDFEIFESLTITPAKLFNLNKKGLIKPGNLADIIIAKKKSNNSLESFFTNNPNDILLIIKSGHIIYFDKSLLMCISKIIDVSKFEKIEIQNTIKYVLFEVKSLIIKIKKHYPNFKHDHYFTIP